MDITCLYCENAFECSPKQVWEQQTDMQTTVCAKENTYVTYGQSERLTECKRWGTFLNFFLWQKFRSGHITGSHWLPRHLVICEKWSQTASASQERGRSSCFGGFYFSQEKNKTSKKSNLTGSGKYLVLIPDSYELKRCFSSFTNECSSQKAI